MITEQTISFDEEFEFVNVEEKEIIKGYAKNDRSQFLLEGFDFKDDDDKKFNPRYKAPVEEVFRGNKVKVAEQKRVKAAKEKEDKKKRLEDLKEYNSSKTYEVEEYLDYELLSNGRYDDDENIVFKESYSLKNFLNKAGRNYTFNIGNLIGGQFQLDKDDMERIANIYINYPKSYKYDITINIPEGYIF